jgi:hypothetical protein
MNITNSILAAKNEVDRINWVNLEEIMWEVHEEYKWGSVSGNEYYLKYINPDLRLGDDIPIPDYALKAYQKDLYLLPASDKKIIRNPLKRTGTTELELKKLHLKEAQKIEEQNQPLYRVFANIPESKEAFLAFSNTYGPLGGCIVVIKNQNKIIPAEPLFFWKQEYWILKNIVRLYDMIQNNSYFVSQEKTEVLFVWPISKENDDNSDISRFIIHLLPQKERLTAWLTNKNLTKKDLVLNFSYSNRQWGKFATAYYNKEFQLTTLSITFGFSPQIKDIINKQEWKKLAKWFLIQVINKQLTKYIIYPAIEMDEETGKFTQKMHPTSVLAAMWFELEQELTGEKKVVQCSICKKWYNGHNVNSKWKAHYSCKQKDNVRKSEFMNKYKVRSMFKNGLSNEEIIKTLKDKDNRIVTIEELERWRKKEVSIFR